MIELSQFPHYGITELGYVYSYKTRRWIKPYKRAGYMHVSLSVSGKSKTMKVHRLVSMAYILNPENKPEVNHIDSNPLNNNMLNLEWVTHRENVLHMVKSGRHVGRSGIRKEFCKRGHSLDEQNIYTQPSNNRRACKACRKLSSKEYYENITKKRIAELEQIKETL